MSRRLHHQIISLRRNSRNVRWVSFIPENFIPGLQKRIEFADQKVLRYPAEDIYSVVADIDKYKEFLPWCQESRVIKRNDQRHCVAQLAVGFPPLVERYTSYVTFEPHSFVRSIANDGRLFKHMETTWIFRPGPSNIPGPSTLVAMKTIFEFRSMLYASLGTPIFSEVARTLSLAFEERFKQLYGESDKLH